MKLNIFINIFISIIYTVINVLITFLYLSKEITFEETIVLMVGLLVYIQANKLGIENKDK